MTTLTGAAYCSQFAHTDPCCHNASDITICGAVPQNNLQDGLIPSPKEGAGAAYCASISFASPCCTKAAVKMNEKELAKCLPGPLNLATASNDVTVTKFLQQEVGQQLE